MSESSPPDKAVNGSPETLEETEEALDKLRELLLSPYRAQLDKLQERLDTPELRARDVSRVLPEAIAQRSTQDRKIEIALEPITAKAIRSSIKKDRQVLVDALFPVMGPAIRKAIAAAIQGMIQSFNQVLEHSVSIKGLKWRLEALRTRKPFAEIVLLHTLVYQVEQVFLIHRDSGLVLQHVVAGFVEAQDPDLVSGMLTAIKDFVQDSFGAQKEEALETMRVGERNVWIEHGQHAILAAVIRGNPPVDFQQLLRDAVDEIHFKESRNLASFNGDSAPYESVRYILDSCLQAQFKKEKRKSSYLLPILVGVILVVVGFGIFNSYRDHSRWSMYVADLRNEPGIVIAGVANRAGKRHVFGLRDPLATDPQKLLKEAGLDPADVIFHWEPYHSFHPPYARRRIQAIFNPPPSVTLGFKEGILHASGTATRQWLEETARLAAAVPWIEALRAEKVIDIDLKLRPPDSVTLELVGRTLYARGFASHKWIETTRPAVLNLPGIDRYIDQELIDSDLQRLENLDATLQKRVFLFQPGRIEMIAGQEDAVADLVKDIREFFAHAEAVGRRYIIAIIGHSAATGSGSQNLQISRERAEALRDLLVARNLAKEKFIVIGVGPSQPVREEISESDRIHNRSVTLRPARWG
ncbi:MAG: OmpA family protein [Deltaproteobacteria bacterium]|nr:OmpA family protein [Deltaproteobacteria bacterium]